MSSLPYYLLLALLLFLLTILVLFSLSSKYPAAAFYSRILLSWASLFACACYGVVASAVLRCVGYGGLSQWTVARAFKWCMRLTTGIEFVVQGGENLTTRPAVFIGNHQTYVCAVGVRGWGLEGALADLSLVDDRELDVLMLGTVFPPYCSVTAKKSLKYIPFLGWFSATPSTLPLPHLTVH